MKAHEEAVFKERSGLMHYVQGYLRQKTDFFISMSLTVDSMGSIFINFGGPELGGPKPVRGFCT